MLRSNLADLEENGAVGDWCFHEDEQGKMSLFLRYPIQQEPGTDYVRLPISTHETPGCWHWNGSRDVPTLTPSIHVIGHWHGYLTLGHLVTV